MAEYEYGSLREKIAAEGAERRERYEKFAALWQKAQEAGRAAALATIPQPMVVGQHASPLDDSSPVRTLYVPDQAMANYARTVHPDAEIIVDRGLNEGVCGFGWISVRPGNSSFAQWAKKNAGFNSGGSSMGTYYWVGDYNQSYERKVAHARAAAKVLSDGLAEMGMGNVKVYGTGRLD
jgi:hypothetical protein